MKTERSIPLILLGIIFFLAGCSGKKETTTSSEGFASPEEVFEAMKTSPDGSQVDVCLPEEWPMIAYDKIGMARVVLMFHQDPKRREAAEKAYEKLIKKYELTDRLEFTDKEDQMPALAKRAFKDVDLHAFMADVSKFSEDHNPSTVPTAGDADEASAGSPDEEMPTYASLEDLTVEGDLATAILMFSDTTEEKAVFVRKKGRWFYSMNRSREANSENEVTAPQKIAILFDSERSMEDATAKHLLAGVHYDRSSRITLKKFPSARGGVLRFMIPLGGDGPTPWFFEIHAEIAKVPGVEAILDDAGCLEMYELCDAIEGGAVDHRNLAQWMEKLAVLFIDFDFGYNCPPHDASASKVREKTGSPLSLAGGNVLNQLMAFAKVSLPLPLPRLQGGKGEWIYSPGKLDRGPGEPIYPDLVSPVFDGMCLILRRGREVVEITEAERETLIASLEGTIVVRGPRDQEPPSIVLDPSELKAAFERTMKTDLDDTEVVAGILRNAVSLHDLEPREAHHQEGYLDVACSPETGRPYSGWVIRETQGLVALYCVESGVTNGPLRVWYGTRSKPNQGERGPKRNQGQMLMGLRTGAYTSFYPNGDLMTEMAHGDHGRLESVTVRKPDGELCAESGVDENGDGVIIAYRLNGSIEERHHYKGGWITKVEKVADAVQEDPPKSVPLSRHSPQSQAEATSRSGETAGDTEESGRQSGPQSASRGRLEKRNEPPPSHSATELTIFEARASSELAEEYNGKPQVAERLLEYDSLATWWTSAEGVTEATINLELGAESSLNGAIVRWKREDGPVGARALHYTIETSLDGNSWKLAYTHKEADPNRAEDDVSFEPIPAKHVRIHMTHSSYGNKGFEGESRPSYFSARWIKLYGDGPPPVGVTWTCSDGGTVEGLYWGMDGGVVRLKNAATGEVSAMPFDRLSPESIARAKAMYLKQPGAEAVAAGKGDAISPRRLPREGEVVFESVFDAGTTYRFKYSWEHRSVTADSIFAFDVRRDKSSDRLTGNLSLDRFKVKSVFKVDRQAPVQQILDSEGSPSGEIEKRKVDSLKGFRNDYHLGAGGRRLEGTSNGGDAEFDGGQMNSVIRHLIEGLPVEPVSSGHEWEYIKISGAGVWHEPMRLSCRYTGLSPIPGGGSVAENRGRFRKVTFSGKCSFDKAGRATPPRSRFQDDPEDDRGIKTVELTGEMYYDPDRRMVIYYAFSSGYGSSSEDFSTTAKLTCELVDMKANVALDSAARPAADPHVGEQPRSGALVAQREWTDSKGRKLTASLVELRGNMGSFRRPDGGNFQYDTTKLLAGDQEIIRAAAKETPSAKWSQLDGKVVTVPSDPSEPCQTGITLAEGDRYRLYPCPDDRWNTSPQRWEDVDYRGHPGPEVTSEGKPYLQLCFRVGSAGVAPVEPEVTVTGSGPLQLFPSDASDTRGSPSNNRGSIRVKVVRVP